ncbi:MAG: T9SS type A sorting domain-containing protein [Chitinophagaceae bacterium]
MVNFASGNKNNNTAVWPNPARNTINIDNNVAGNSTATVNFYDLSGKLNMQKQLQTGVNAIDISMLPAGNYIAKVNTDNGNSFTQKIIKL